jgi:hypothetical protein
MRIANDNGRLRRIFLWLMAFALLSFAYYEYFQCFPKNSDDANCLLAGFDMWHGNVWLAHWRLGPDHFYTGDILAYGILTRLFGVSPKFLSLLPALFWAAVVLLSLKGVLVCGGKPHSPASIAFALTLIGLPIVVPQSNAPMHVATMIYCLAIFLLGRRLLLSPAIGPLGYLAMFVLTAAAVAGDPLTVVVCVLPILITCALIAAPESGKKAILIACVLVAATITGRVAVSFITRHGGFVPLNLPMRFGDFDKFALRFHSGSLGLVDIFGINFFGKGATPAAGYSSLGDYIARGPIAPLLRIPLAIFAAAAVAQFGRALYGRFVTRDPKAPAASGEYLLHFAFWAVTLTVLGAFLSEVLEGSPPSSRFFIPALIFATIMGAVEVQKRWWGTGYTIAVLAVSLVTVVAVYAVTQGARHKPNDEQREVAAWLQDHSLSEGYGSYWSSSIITVLTSNRVKVRALAAAGDTLAPYVWWNCNTAWYTRPATDGPPQRFVLVDRAPVLGALTEEQVVATLGQPAQAVPVGKFVVFIYDVSTTDFSKLVVQYKLVAR